MMTNIGKTVWRIAGAWSAVVLGVTCVGRAELLTNAPLRALKVALVQFDAVPEQPARNLKEMERLARAAVEQGARLVMFHEGTLTDYTQRLAELAEPVPTGPACQRLIELAKELDCRLSFGLSERDGDRFYITQVFVGPEGFIYRYRKTWLWLDEKDEGYRNEWVRYDPGTGPELFLIDGLTATCFICADGEAPRCVQRAKALMPQLVFYPNNRAGLPDFPVFGARAAEIGAPVLVTNRVGRSWMYPCAGGCVAFDAQGRVLAKANRDGREEVLLLELILPEAIETKP